jgi:hypothetical protein
VEWYRVTKTIKGRKYDYWQKTYRAGGTVKTLNKYIGPSQSTLRGQPIPGWRTMTKAQRYNVKLDRIFHDAKIWNQRHDVLREVEKQRSDNPESGNPEGEQDDLHGTVPPQEDRFLAPFTPEEAKAFIGPATKTLEGEDKRDYERAATRERKGDERVLYGPLKTRLKRHAAALRAAKRRAKGAKAINPYLAILMRKDKPAPAPEPKPKHVHDYKWELQPDENGDIIKLCDCGAISEVESSGGKKRLNPNPCKWCKQPNDRSETDDVCTGCASDIAW